MFTSSQSWVLGSLAPEDLGGPRSSACVLVCGAGSWALLWMCGLKDTGGISPSVGRGPAVRFTKSGSAGTQGKGTGTKGNVSPSTRTPRAPGPRPCVSTHCFSVTDCGYRGIMSTVLEGEEVMKGCHLNAGEPLSSEHPTCYRLTCGS